MSQWNRKSKSEFNLNNSDDNKNTGSRRGKGSRDDGERGSRCGKGDRGGKGGKGYRGGKGVKGGKGGKGGKGYRSDNDGKGYRGDRGGKGDKGGKGSRGGKGNKERKSLNRKTWKSAEDTISNVKKEEIVPLEEQPPTIVRTTSQHSNMSSDLGGQKLQRRTSSKRGMQMNCALLFGDTRKYVPGDPRGYEAERNAKQNEKINIKQNIAREELLEKRSDIQRKNSLEVMKKKKASVKENEVEPETRPRKIEPKTKQQQMSKEDKEQIVRDYLSGSEDNLDLLCPIILLQMLIKDHGIESYESYMDKHTDTFISLLEDKLDLQKKVCLLFYEYWSSNMHEKGWLQKVCIFLYQNDYVLKDAFVEWKESVSGESSHMFKFFAETNKFFEILETVTDSDDDDDDDDDEKEDDSNGEKESNDHSEEDSDSTSRDDDIDNIYGVINNR